MNGIDIGILIIVGLFAIDGMRRGFLLGLLDLVALVLAIVIGGQFAVPLGEQLQRFGLSGQLANGAGFIVAAVVSLAIIGFVVRILLSPVRALTGTTALAWVNSVLGLLPGALRGLAVAALLVNILLWMSTAVGQRTSVVPSPFALSVAATGRQVLDAGLAWAGIDVAGIFAPGAAAPVATTPQPVSNVAAVERDPKAEETLLALINSDRKNVGIAPLRADSALAAVARTRGQETFALGAGEASPPPNGDLSGQLAAAGVVANLSGENITFAKSADLAHTEFMSTPADRANIFNAGFTRVGIAVLRTDEQGLVVAEVFAD